MEGEEQKKNLQEMQVKGTNSNTRSNDLEEIDTLQDLDFQGEPEEQGIPIILFYFTYVFRKKKKRLISQFSHVK